MAGAGQNYFPCNFPAPTLVHWSSGQRSCKTWTSTLHRPAGMRAAKLSTDSPAMIMRSLAATRLAARSLRPVSRSTSAALLVSTPNVATTHSSRRLHTSSPCRKQGGDDIPSERPPTNFSELDVLGGMPAPSTSVDVCMHDGFGLNSGITISGGDGAMLVNGEAFSWRPWEAVGQKRLLNSKGQFDIPAETLGMLDLLWPRPGNCDNPPHSLPPRAAPGEMFYADSGRQICSSLAWARRYGR